MIEGRFLFCDGKFLPSGLPLIQANNRSFRYGDGCFETMKLANGRIVLEDLHFERLFASIACLQFERPARFTADYLQNHISELAAKNGHAHRARVRLTIFRGEGGLYDRGDAFPHHLIQTWELAESGMNENGLAIGVFPDARKACDAFSHLKSNNFLAYSIAARWAGQNRLNEALVLNPHGRIADATIANVFIVADGMIKTPALEEGCVNGVMRRHLLQSLHSRQTPVQETAISVGELMSASEVFLTNAIAGIRWVKSLGDKHFENRVSAGLYRDMVNPLG